MNAIEIDQPVANFHSIQSDNTPWQLADQRGHWVVLFFFPKANTPGCTVESQDFRDRQDAFKALGAELVGISRDGPKTLANFAKKHDFAFTLLGDKDEQVCEHFGVMRDKKMFGKPVRGIERSTFLIDPEGILREQWRKVSVDGHAQAVLDSLTTQVQR